MPRAVEIDAVALVEVGFRFARDNGGKVKDEIGAVRDQFLCGPGLRESRMQTRRPETSAAWARAA
jgi:hypothetical protein